ncbi:unnamed protein product [Orchesella dallaii]|uniref:Helicase C-terminal domain-containing protein n=1 Tax=Orchesella dallaii TaxID=48710 RepID=A0ABP1R4L2_9HEXA
MKLEKIVQDLEATEKKLLVFCNTIEKTVEIFNFLHQSEYKDSGIHSDLTQDERTQALKDFDAGRSTILIATSVATRGLNIRGIDLVLNYDLPKDINEYIQRIGRTGRVGVVGESISFFDEDTDEDLAKDLVDALTSGNQSVPTFLSEFCSVADGEEFGSSEEALHFGMKKLKVKRCFEDFEEEDAF